jgi:hypothetical protein
MKMPSPPITDTRMSLKMSTCICLSNSPLYGRILSITEGVS